MAKEMPIHEAAGIFPLDEGRIDELAADVKKHGLLVPIELLDSKVLDGRRRLLACIKAGVEPRFKAVKVDDPVAYVLSLNLHRRHLTTSQWAMVGARAAELFKKQAKERQKRKPLNSVVANLPPQDAGKARDAAGAAVGVSGKMIDLANKVIAEAVPEVVQAVDQGRMAVSTAALLTSHTADDQRAYAAGLPLESEPPDPKKTTPRPVGVVHAVQAINCLERIPEEDPHFRRGLDMVSEWIAAALMPA
jgi:ParB-like chromosome segregation protein Spo0J